MTLSTIDQENVRKYADDGRNAAKQQQLQPQRIKRVPLAGKDHNQLTLNKSHTTINSKGRATPPLTKSKSSLGFVHKPVVKEPTTILSAEKSKVVLAQLKKDTLNFSKASRKVQLVNRNLVTDDLIKRELPALPKINSLGVIPKLQYIPNNDINANNVDPVKKYKTKIRNEIIIPEHLLEDEFIESIPDRVSPPSPPLPTMKLFDDEPSEDGLKSEIGLLDLDADFSMCDVDEIENIEIEGITQDDILDIL